MATHDYVIDNGTGAAVRTDLNNVLSAIVSNNSSSSEPSTKYAYQWWADTTTGILKIRNSSNNGWVELLQLDGTLTLEDGSASTPGLAFRDDLNTGIFSSGADNFDIATGGSVRANVSSTGLAVTGNVSATTFVGNIDAVDGDFDGTLEADAITVAGVALNTVIAGVTVANATNASTLDTIDSTSFLRSDATDSATGLLSLDKIQCTGRVSADITTHGGGTVTLDFDTSVHHLVNLTQNSTFAQPNNQNVGTSGSIFLVQDGTGSRTGSFNAAFKFVGGNAPTLSTAANAIDRIDFIIKASNEIQCAVSLDIK